MNHFPYQAGLRLRTRSNPPPPGPWWDDSRLSESVGMIPHRPPFRTPGGLVFLSRRGPSTAWHGPRPIKQKTVGRDHIRTMPRLPRRPRPPRSSASRRAAAPAHSAASRWARSRSPRSRSRTPWTRGTWRSTSGRVSSPVVSLWRGWGGCWLPMSLWSPAYHPSCFPLPYSDGLLVGDPSEGHSFFFHLIIFTFEVLHMPTFWG